MKRALLLLLLAGCSGTGQCLLLADGGLFTEADLNRQLGPPDLSASTDAGTYVWTWTPDSGHLPISAEIQSGCVVGWAAAYRGPHP